jgi:hypothetical protein
MAATMPACPPDCWLALSFSSVLPGTLRGPPSQPRFPPWRGAPPQARHRPRSDQRSARLATPSAELRARGVPSFLEIPSQPRRRAIVPTSRRTFMRSSTTRLKDAAAQTGADGAVVSAGVSAPATWQGGGATTATLALGATGPTMEATVGERESGSESAWASESASAPSSSRLASSPVSVLW